MKIKTLIGMLAVAGAMTGFSATDAELKAMLDAKDYENFVKQAPIEKLTNVTETAAEEIINYCMTTNKLWSVKFLCEAGFMKFTDAVDLAIENKNPQSILLASWSKDDELLASTWAKVIDLPELDAVYLYVATCDNFKLKCNNFELYQKTAEKILSKQPQIFLMYVFNGLQSTVFDWSDNHIGYAQQCMSKINETTITLDNFCVIWLCDLQNFKTKEIRNEKYFYPNIWKIEKQYKTDMVEHYTRVLWSLPYKEKVMDIIADSVKDPITAKYFADEIDNRAKNQEMTKKLYNVISKDKTLAFSTAIYLKDADKVIDALLVSNEDLNASDLNKAIPMINSLEIDYRKDDIIRALRNINGRYTLKLYDERETWEPILSKIRALIDVRQM